MIVCVVPAAHTVPEAGEVSVIGVGGATPPVISNASVFARVLPPVSGSMYTPMMR